MSDSNKPPASMKQDDEASASQPSFRFAQIQASAQSEVIDKSSYFGGKSQAPLAAAIAPVIENSSSWCPIELRPVPAFYPLEKSSRLVEDDTASDVVLRLTDCLRRFSIHALYDNECATASLMTQENVEMHLSLWKTSVSSPQHGIVVELQRRKGDSITFHRYSRQILDAAVGDLDMNDVPMELLDDIQHSRKVQRLLQTQLQNKDQEEHENAIIAMEIAHGLLMKDRMDARQLGLESLCLLTDPRKTGYITAVMTAHVVLLGSAQSVLIPGVRDESSGDVMMDEGPFQEIRESILSLVQFSRLAEDDEDRDYDTDVSPDSEQMTLLHNLALAVLANALDVIENPDRYHPEPEDTKPRSRLRTASSNDVANEFLQATEESSNKDLLATLIGELGKASHKPHNATLSAKCIGSLCRASDEARRKAKELGAKNVVSTALDVGVRSHLKLETECKRVVKILTLTDQS